MLKVLHISGASKSSGAGYAALMTHNALIENEVCSKILFLVGENELNSRVYHYSSGSILKKVLRFATTTIDRLPNWLYVKRKNQIFSLGFFGLKHRNSKLFDWADIIHIHWSNHGLIDIKEIVRWNKPVIWTLRDMWAFTGGCHYSLGCDKYQKKCGACPVLGSVYNRDLSTLGFKYKERYLSNSLISWVAISDWMRSKAMSSTILNGKHIPIVFSGIDCKVFKLRCTKESRQFFGLPFEKKIILIGAGNLREEYKGFNYVINTLNLIDENYLIVTFGAGQINKTEIPQNIINLGYIRNPEELSILYNSSDVFFAPSIAEAFGKTFAEAQACGLPVLCFDETGPAEIVEHTNTGYIAEFKNETDLLKGIQFCLNTSFDRSSISKRAICLFDINKTAVDYIALYKASLE
jgi:glycosyltransferase involved in cell wall biosynthesis